ncbi:MAG: energy-coupling factor ABC transporter permease [Desulforhopalus sp.]
MHITEGIITGPAAVFYTAAGVALVGYGTSRMKKFVAAAPEKRPLLGMAGALIFFVSLLPIPAFTGTCSHPCGTPLIAILFGPGIAIALTGGSLLLQAAFFAHGGFGTWGANVVALGFFGCFAGWSGFWLARKLGFSLWGAGFAGGLFGDIMVYVASGLILAGELANAPTPQYAFGGYLAVIFTAYLPTQLPIALGEMVITGLSLQYIYNQRPEVLIDLGLIKSDKVLSGKSRGYKSLVLLFIVTSLLIPINRAVADKDGTATVVEQSPGQETISDKTISYSGMDEAVNEKLAEEAGIPPRDPFIDTEAMGDLWNALLLLGGGICGFVLGRWWHLISKKKNNVSGTGGGT